MPPDDVNSTATADPGLPDWLTGTDGAADSWPAPPGLLDLPPLFADPAPTPARAPAPAPVAETPPAAVADTRGPAPRPDGWTRTRQEVPHDPADPVDARSYRFSVSNTARDAAFECAVELALPAGCRGIRASHAAKRTKAGLEWHLGVLEPGAHVALLARVPLTPPAAPLAHGPAAVTIATRPVVPMLTVAAEAPAEVRGGEPVAVTVVLSNPGRGPLKPGAVALSGAGGRVAAATFAELPAGGTARLALALPPQPAGPARYQVTAVAPGAPPAHTTVEFVTVFAPLAVALTAPERVETDEEFECRLGVTIPAGTTAVRVELPVPDELVFRSATAGGALAVAGDRVEWVIDGAPAGTWEATARFAGFAPGRARLRASVSRPGARAATAEAELDCVIRRGAGTTLAEVMAGIALPDPPADASGSATAPRATEARHLVVRSSRARLAVPLAGVRDVLRPLPLTALPGTPDWVAGVANVRGDIVTVIDLAPFLDLGEPGPRRGLIVFRAEGAEPLGALVDEVTGIRIVGADTESPIDDRLARFLAGVGADADGVVHRLNIATLVAAVETELGGPA